MNHEQAKKILIDVDATFSEAMDTVILNGEYTIEQLHALLQLMEYNA